MIQRAGGDPQTPADRRCTLVCKWVPVCCSCIATDAWINRYRLPLIAECDCPTTPTNYSEEAQARNKLETSSGIMTQAFIIMTVIIGKCVLL